ncbi:hypothetical protein [Vibrio cholerae]|uniref:hypothetical protein n=1 Tax=Vibrio cholerae TaxID=666 RepID=UPI0030804E98
MPVVITFDIEAAPSQERNRIQSAFERFGWQNLGGSSYRYPRLGTEDQPVEDWFNHVIPALTLFRQYLISSGRSLGCFTLDVQSTTGFDLDTGFGTAPQNPDDVRLYAPTNTAFGERNLKQWLGALTYPYPVGDSEE